MIHITVDLEQEDPRFLNEGKEGRGTLCSAKGTEMALDLFKKYGVKVTFFVSGFFAEKFPDLVKKISTDGHEVGCHGYSHSYKEMSKKEIEEDIKKAKAILEGVGCSAITGFRAPQMTYEPKVVETTHKLGFSYGSTLHSAWMPGKYNHKLSPAKPFFPLSSGPFMEIPVSGSPKIKLPLTSHMIRTLGATWIVGSCKKLKEKNINPVLSIHSWDLSPVNTKGLPRKYCRKTGTKFVSVMERLFSSFPAQEFTSLNTEVSRESKQ